MFACFHGFVSGWAFSGMETIFYAMLVAIMCYGIMHNASSNLLSILMAVIMLVRHDGALLLPVYVYIMHDRVKKHGYKQYIYILAVATFVGIYYIWRYHYYGVVVPHTITAKSHIIYYESNVTEIMRYWVSYASSVLFMFICSLWSLYVKRIRHHRNIIVITCYILVSFIVYSFGLRSDMVRYTVHLFPVLILVVFHVLTPKFLHNNGVIYAFIVLFAANSFISFGTFSKFTHDYKSTQHARCEMGKYINVNIDRGETIASGDLGAIAYMAKSHIFYDKFGLVSTKNIHGAAYIADTFDADAVDINNNKAMCSSFPEYDVIAVNIIDNKLYCIALLEKNKN